MDIHDNNNAYIDSGDNQNPILSNEKNNMLSFESIQN